MAFERKSYWLLQAATRVLRNAVTTIPILWCSFSLFHVLFFLASSVASSFFLCLPSLQLPNQRQGTSNDTVQSHCGKPNSNTGSLFSPPQNLPVSSSTTVWHTQASTMMLVGQKFFGDKGSFVIGMFICSVFS